MHHNNNTDDTDDYDRRKHHRHRFDHNAEQQHQQAISIVFGNTTVNRGDHVAYTITSPSKHMLESMYLLFWEYGHGTVPQAPSAAHKSSLWAAQLKMNFTMTKPVATTKRGGDAVYEISVIGNKHAADHGGKHHQQYSVTCTTLSEYMQNRTRAMSYERTLRMMELLQKQMTDLEVLNLSTPYYSLDDILIINDVFFCFANDDKLFSYDAASKQMDVTRAISRERAFYAPELLQPSSKIHALPYSVDYRASYYSMGMLAAYCALLKPELVAVFPSIIDGGRKKRLADRPAGDQPQQARVARVISTSEIIKMLNPIQYTKLYWFITRCCNDDVAHINNRMPIFV